MAKRFRYLDIPIHGGQREDSDKRMLPQGSVERVQNMRLRKDGRWGVRRDFTALGRSIFVLDTWVAVTVLGMAGGQRLISIGGNDDDLLKPVKVVAEHVGQEDDWRGAHDPPGSVEERLSIASGVEELGRIPPNLSGDIIAYDVAIHDGIVCLVCEIDDVLSPLAHVHVFYAATGATIFSDRVFNREKPRVTEAGGAFFISMIDGTSIELYRMDPASDNTLVQLTDAFGSGATIGSYDLCRGTTSAGFWVALYRTTPAVGVRHYTDSGVQNVSFNGPLSVAYDHVAISETENRVNVAVVRSSDGDVDLFSYTTSGTQSPASATTLGVETDRQPGMESVETNQVVVAIEDIVSDDRDVLVVTRDDDDHTSRASNRWNGGRLGSKPKQVGPSSSSNVFAVGVLYSEPGDFFSSAVALVCRTAGGSSLAALGDKLTAVLPDLSHTPTLATDEVSGETAWPVSEKVSVHDAVPVVKKLSLPSSSWRQTAEIGGRLYIAGGAICTFDGRDTVEAGFWESPRIISATASNSTGLLPSNTAISVVAVCRWVDSKGDLHQSAPSNEVTVQMGASDDTISVTGALPHGMRFGDVFGSNVRVQMTWYRTLEGRNELREAVSNNAITPGDVVSATMLLSDDSIAENAVIYTQSGREALGSILPFEAPEPAEFIWTFGKRIITGGLPDRQKVQVSRPLLEDGEPVNWSGDVAFFLRIPEPVTGVASIDGTGFIFSRSGIWRFTGDGPDDSGSGSFTEPLKLPSSTGLKDARSLVETPLGLMFQGDDDKLWLLPRGGGSPQSIGDAIEDTLSDYPTIVGASVMRQEQVVTFASTDGTDSRLMSLDLRETLWTVDDLDGEVLTSLSEYLGRAVYSDSSGVVRTQDADLSPDAFIAHGLTTGPIVFPGGAKIRSAIVLGEFRGNCTLNMEISYDDGDSWTTIGDGFQLDTADGLSAGSSIRREWFPARRKGDRFKLRLAVTDLSGAATEGFVVNELKVSYIPTQGGPRLGPGSRT